MESEYNYEYIIFCEKIIEELIDKLAKEVPEAFHLAGCSVKIPLKKYLFMQMAFNNLLRQEFNSKINEGKSQEKIELYFHKYIFERFSQMMESLGKNETETTYMNYLESNLKPFRNKIVYYTLNERFLRFALPVLSKIQEDVVVLCESTISDDFECSENIKAIEFSFLNLYRYENSIIHNKFPFFFFMVNTLSILWEFLSPKMVLVVEGNHPEYEILGLLGQRDNINVCCLQQGWPGILQPGFQNMQYSHFIAWGKEFSEILEVNNPVPKFISAGYPFEVEDNDNRNAICFFLQAPRLISSTNNYRELIELSIFCAEKFPTINILIREHPDFQLPEFYLDIIKEQSNIRLMAPATHPVYDVYKQSFLSVSIFSSTIIESLVHNVIPFIFNPTSMPNYYPDLNKEGLAVEANSLNSAKEKISELITNPFLIKKYQEKISQRRHDFFEATGEEAVENIVKYIADINKER